MGAIIFYFIFGILIESVLVFIFDMNYVPTIITCILFGFFINNAMPMKKNYPFLRLSIIIFAMYFASQYLLAFAGPWLQEFYIPSSLWKVLIVVSFPISIIYYFGKRGNGSKSNVIQSVAILPLATMIITSFILFWWKGALAFIITRFILQILEENIAVGILTSVMKSYESRFSDQFNERV